MQNPCLTKNRVDRDRTFFHLHITSETMLRFKLPHSENVSDLIWNETHKRVTYQTVFRNKMTITRSEHGLKFKEWLQMFWPCPGFAATMNVSFANTCSFRNKSLHNKVRLIVIVIIGIFIQETTKPTNFETYCIQISVAAAKKIQSPTLGTGKQHFPIPCPTHRKMFLLFALSRSIYCLFGPTIFVEQRNVLSKFQDSKYFFLWPKFEAFVGVQEISLAWQCKRCKNLTCKRWRPKNRHYLVNVRLCRGRLPGIKNYIWNLCEHLGLSRLSVAMICPSLCGNPVTKQKNVQNWIVFGCSWFVFLRHHSRWIARSQI